LSGAHDNSYNFEQKAAEQDHGTQQESSDNDHVSQQPSFTDMPVTTIEPSMTTTYAFHHPQWTALNNHFSFTDQDMEMFITNQEDLQSKLAHTDGNFSLGSNNVPFWSNEDDYGPFGNEHDTHMNAQSSQ
jgi:hypothetical protein